MTRLRIKNADRRDLLAANDYPSKDEQLGALWKIVAVLTGRLTEEDLKAIPESALAVMQAIAETKGKYPKRGDRK